MKLTAGLRASIDLVCTIPSTRQSSEVLKLKYVIRHRYQEVHDQYHSAVEDIQSFSRKPRNLRAQAQLNETKTETCELLVKREKKDRGARAGVTVDTSFKPIC
ncbi:hypothetical protein TNCV_858711 [Trichonephila clavipes]|nr:hypothetical protein TNCV_858711 [Trichonephila clavipes]